MRRALGILLFVLALCLSTALADHATIVTPGGKLNMRKTPEDKGRIVTYVPNGASVEVEELGETWSLVTYKNKSGYVKTEYLYIVVEPEPLPEGEVQLTVSADELKVGEVVDFSVAAWAETSCVWQVTKDGESFCAPEDATHFSAALRPREEGSYEVTVTVTDENGLSVSRTGAFTVSGTA